ncbi:MAG: hypothetical protein M0C28_37130 [Candidatus Moduliflexus flocculans]|nr:hypothetical protein [Candidatus Moduliflexus flocculans]
MPSAWTCSLSVDLKGHDPQPPRPGQRPLPPLPRGLRAVSGDSAHSGGIARTLRDMHHLAFLNRYIPEFERIYCKVQHDAYHIYTVDTHTLFCVEELEKLWLGEYREKKPVLHPGGRGNRESANCWSWPCCSTTSARGGRTTATAARDMIPTIARRLNLNREDSQRLEFLVRRHLDMAHISQRRDLHDDRLIHDFAQRMGMSENLRMLFLLTFADIKGVGPDVWSEWKGSLLQELYEKAFDVLERGDFYKDLRSERVRNRTPQGLRSPGRGVRRTGRSASCCRRPAPVTSFHTAPRRSSSTCASNCGRGEATVAIDVAR